MSRLSVECILDLVAIRRNGRNVLDMLLTAAIVQANLAEINRRADLQMTYADVGAVVPDELRRPIHLLAIANSLGAPFETVRRRVKAMVDDGLCRLGPDGVIIPAEVLTSPVNVATGLRAYERMRTFYYQLMDAGLLADLPPPSVGLTADATPLRAVGRLLFDYVLRVVDTLGPITPDLLDRLIFLEIFRENVEGFPVEVVGGDTLEARDMVPDADRRPIVIRTLADRLGLPLETVRRHVAALVAEGVCERRETGLIVPSTALGRPPVRAAIQANAANLHRLFAGLSQLGVLRLWDAMRPESGGPVSGRQGLGDQTP
ncbi:helix-turn-helix domain-containing protein [Phenylobacterium soli]|uniref:hypothetical protein n=1 Tax=Phenylobacterium soli TaxID=2170551 RepID=UPI00187564A9|nr:hypothetical protein [Phenylobacterium soli]